MNGQREKMSTTLQCKWEYYSTQINKAEVKTVIYRPITVAE